MTKTLEPIDHAIYKPTPADIARWCAEIQREWSDDEREKRAMLKRVEWSVPMPSGPIHRDE